MFTQTHTHIYSKSYCHNRFSSACTHRKREMQAKQFHSSKSCIWCAMHITWTAIASSVLWYFRDELQQIPFQMHWEFKGVIHSIWNMRWAVYTAYILSAAKMLFQRLTFIIGNTLIGQLRKLVVISILFSSCRLFDFFSFVVRWLFGV